MSRNSFCMILEALGHSWRHVRNRCPKTPQIVTPLRPFWEAILDQVCSKVRFLCICLESLFMLIFGIAFGMPPAPIWMDSGSFWVHVGVISHTFWQMLQNCQNATPLKRNAWFWECWASKFAYFLLFFLSCFCVAAWIAFSPEFGRF